MQEDLLKKKHCKKCNKILSVDLFYQSKTAKDGFRNICKDCWKVRERCYKEANPDFYREKAYKYWRDGKDRRWVYQELLKIQANKCAICGIEPTFIGPNDTLCLDHDPQANALRGLLCHKCNRGLGHFRHDVDRLKQVIQYLNGESNILL